VAILNDILATTLADIVVTSDWKHSKNLTDIGDYYAAQGVITRPIDVTSDVNGDYEHYAMRRAAEIEQWLTHHAVTTWCAVDDLWMDLEHFAWAQDPHAAISAPGLADQIKALLLQMCIPKSYHTAVDMDLLAQGEPPQLCASRATVNTCQHISEEYPWSSESMPALP
jgi:hypothetical protein